MADRLKPVTTYTVRKGDTLSSIASSKLGDSSRWGEIAKLNHLPNPDDIAVGQTLKLPKK
ncbi:LysM domain-containing protein [Streptomyces sp. NBC_01381]|uniref:LysM peptidoglycan-binding domain-containing protein n=1 Tax=Streptomyces sp. NBC_01381 TaxID=2903845 RepID=UPI002B1E8146|nr:LysM domain-containing protein [Streptomyces sp. NBC_01381]